MAYPLPLDLVVDFEERLERMWWSKSWARRRDALAIGLGLCGLRCCEVLRSQIRDVLPVDEAIRVRTAKNGVGRIVRVGRSWISAMQAVRAERPPKGKLRDSHLLFYTSKQRPLAYEELRRRMASWTMAVFKRPYSFHCLRHTAAVRMYEATKDVKAVQEFLGHRSLQWTSVYLASLVIRDFEPGLPKFAKDDRGTSLRLFDPDGEAAGEASIQVVTPVRSSTPAPTYVVAPARSSTPTATRPRRSAKKKKGSADAARHLARKAACDHEWVVVSAGRDSRLKVVCRRCGKLYGYLAAKEAARWRKGDLFLGKGAKGSGG